MEYDISDSIMKERGYELHHTNGIGCVRSYNKHFDMNGEAIGLMDAVNPITINAEVDTLSQTVKLSYITERMFSTLHTPDFSFDHKGFRKYESCLVFYAALLHVNDPLAQE